MTRCSEEARARSEPLAGTAPQATVWLAVEQPGPWGSRALTDSRLPAAVREAAVAADAVAGARGVLVRRPGRHADTHDPDRPRRVLLASVSHGRRWLREAVCASVDDLLALDLEGSARSAVDGTPPAWGVAVNEPVVLVCTNGRRDQCCAERGRPVALALADRLGAAVWESSHLGGHRFSPTVLALPAGAVYGGREATDVDATLDLLAGGTLPLAGLRGLTSLDPAQQAADVAARALRGWDGLEATTAGPATFSDSEGLTVTGTGPAGGWTVLVTGPDGAMTVHVDQIERSPRPESCGAAPVPRLDLVTTPLPPVPPQGSPHSVL